MATSLPPTPQQPLLATQTVKCPSSLFVKIRAFNAQSCSKRFRLYVKDTASFRKLLMYSIKPGCQLCLHFSCAKLIECVHDGHVGGPKQYNDFPLGNIFYFYANIFYCFSPPTWPPCTHSIRFCATVAVGAPLLANC